MTTDDQRSADGYRWSLHAIGNVRDDPGLEQLEAFLQSLARALVPPDDREHGGQR